MSDEATRPAEHPDAAIFACDAGHLAYAYAAAMGIHHAEPERRFDIVIATPDLTPVPEVARRGPIRFRRIDVSVIPPFRHGNPRITIGTFFRHLLPEILRDEYGALFYMDTDTWMRRPGLQGLFDRRPRGVPLAAVASFIYRPDLLERPHPVSPRAERVLGAFAGTNGDYWQSGVQMIDIEAHLKARVAERLFSYVETHHDLLERHRLGDQGALNAVFADEIVPLSPLWNWHHEDWHHPDLLERFDPHILHFTGRAKPWMLADEPLVGEVNPDWFAALSQWSPDFTPEARRGSAAWFEANPVFRLRPLDALHRRAHVAVMRHKARRLTIGASGQAAMQALINTAEVA